MGSKEAIAVNIVNRNYPPSPGITGESAAELATFLLERGFRVNVIHIDVRYSGGVFDQAPAGKVHKIKTFYNGKNKLLRLFANLHEGVMLVLKARSVPADVTICMTDPPLLNFWFALFFGSKRKWFLWSMDLFPEAFVASGLVTPGNPVIRMIQGIIARNPPQHIIALGPHQLNHLKQKYRKDIGSSIVPCGIFHPEFEFDERRPDWADDPGKTYFGYCGNLGEAHSDEFILKVIANLDPKKHVFILSVYGVKAEAILKAVKGKPCVRIVSTVKRNELRFIDIHLASLAEQWVNVCVPSKAVSSVCAGSAFLYYGPRNSDNWELLHEAGWLVGLGDLNGQMKTYIDTLSKEAIAAKRAEARKLAELLNRAKRHAFEAIEKEITPVSVG